MPSSALNRDKRGIASCSTLIFSGKRVDTTWLPAALLLNEPVVAAQIVGQQKRRAVRQLAAAAADVKSPRVVIPELEVPFVDRNHLAVDAMPRVLEPQIAQRDDVEPVAILVRPVEPIERKSFERIDRVVEGVLRHGSERDNRSCRPIRRRTRS